MAAPTPSDLAQGVPAGAEIAKRIPGPNGQGELLLDTNGGVYAIGGAQYMGSYHDDNYLDPVHRNDPNRQFYDLVLNEGGGYTLKSDRGWYDLGPRYQELQRQAAEQAAAQQAPVGPAPNSLYTDPAYLNFIRTSDLGIETVADQIRRQNAAIQASLGIDQASRENQGVVERENIYKNYASRGISRSGGRGVDEARQGQQQANDLARLQSGATEQITAGHSQLANAVADRMRQAGEMGFDTAQMQDMERRNEELKQKYPTEFGSGGGGY